MWIDPIFGVIPPLSHSEWQNAFDQYRTSPEYLKVNMHMDVEDFKSIYWFEFAHRLLGRVIGSVFLLPFLFFLWRGWVQRALVPKLVGLFTLGGLQGALGWYMVASGLVDNPHVSHYRLTAHLLLAFLIYGSVFWTALDLLLPTRTATANTLPPRLRSGAWLFLILVLVTVSSGGLVAGLKAGFAYSTFPLMDGHLVPEVIFLLEPRWRNFFENIATVQFDHRLLATLVLLVGIIVWLRAQRLYGPLRRRAHLLLAMIAVQIALGISTLLLHVPVALASAHQAGALVLFTLALYYLHGVRHSAHT